MISERHKGFILRRSNFGEADKTIVLFSRSHGKIKLIAKGIRRIKSRRAPHLELFNLSEVLVHKNIIVEAKTLKSPKADLESIGYLFYISEILDRLLPEGVPHPKIFDALEQSGFSQNDTKAFTLEVLWDLGYLPKGSFPKQGITNFVESTIERPVKSKKFLEDI